MREHDAKVVQPLECLLICSSATCVFQSLPDSIECSNDLTKSPAEKPKPGVTMAKGPEGSKRH